MRTWSILLVVILLAIGLGCADKTPAGIDFTPPPFIVKWSPISIEASVVNQKGSRIEGIPLIYAATPADVAEVSATGSFRCQKTGDATLVLSGGGITSEHTMKCRIPTEIVMPGLKEIILKNKPVELKARALAEGGRAMEDVPVELSSSDPSILRVENGSAHPVAIGKIRLKGSVGGVSAVASLEVVDRVVSERLSLEDGAKRSWELESGLYRVGIDVASTHNNVAHGVMVSWDKVKCPDQLEAQSHTLTCAVLDKATVTVTNPATYGLGLPVNGTLRIDLVSGD